MGWCPVLQIADPQQYNCQYSRLLQGRMGGGGERAHGCDCNYFRKHITLFGIASDVDDTTVLYAFLPMVCSIWVPQQVQSSPKPFCRLLWVHWCHKWQMTFKTGFQQARGKLFWHLKWNTSIYNPLWPLMCPCIPKWRYGAEALRSGALALRDRGSMEDRV